jgi:VWFA-related protein
MSNFHTGCLALVLCFPLLAASQQIPAPAVSDENIGAQLFEDLGLGFTLRTSPGPDTSLGFVQLDVTVTDKSGKPVKGLGVMDFTLLDNGQPQKIVSFRAFDGTTAKPNPPVEVILVMDSINLSDAQFFEVEKSVDKFLRRNGGNLFQPVSVYLLSSEGLLVTPWPTTDGNLLATEIARKSELRPVLVNKVISYEAVPFTYHEKSPNRNRLSLNALGMVVLAERQTPGRKLLLWLSGGWPVQSNESVAFEKSFDWITEFSTRMREAHIELFSLNAWTPQVQGQDLLYLNYLPGVKSAREANPPNMALEVLALQSGGRIVDASDGFSGEIEKLAADANAFYAITFDPPRADFPDEYHELNMKLGKPELEARTRTGYYDQPSFFDQPYQAAERVTVEQLEQKLEADHHGSDSELAAELTAMELTERMSGSQLTQLKTGLRGAKSQAALAALADASAFLNSPPATVPSLAPPDLATQRQMLAKTVDYLSKTIPKLPDFFATRTTTRYRETEQKDQQILVWKTAVGDRSLRKADTSIASVTYRNGYEVVDDGIAKGKKPKREETSLNTKGTFGPILNTVTQDAARSELAWSRWEEGAGGMRAVFRYAVPQAKSHYEQTYCCLFDSNGNVVLKRMSGYHGEIMIDPESGAILRITVEADWPPRMPVLRSDIMVQYGPQTIGGNTYICPVRSVSYWRGRREVSVHEWGQSFRVYGPFETMLDDVTFTDYHLFRGEARILTGYDPPPEEKSPDPAPTQPAQH